MTAVLDGFRSWALGDPQRFALIFGPPMAGYAAPPDAPSTAEAKRSMAAVESVLVDARDRGVLAPGIVREVGAPLVGVLLATRNVLEGEPLEPATYQAMLHAWIAVHGFVSLEAFGHLEWMPPPARDALFAAQLELCLAALGL